jgi:hypothetical protein
MPNQNPIQKQDPVSDRLSDRLSDRDQDQSDIDHLPAVLALCESIKRLNEIKETLRVLGAEPKPPFHYDSYFLAAMAKDD